MSAAPYSTVATPNAPSAVGPYRRVDHYLPSRSLPCRVLSRRCEAHRDVDRIYGTLLWIHSQAIKTDSLIFCSGCVPLVPETMKVIEGGVEEQTVRPALSPPCNRKSPIDAHLVSSQEQAMKNLTAVVEAAGSDLSHVVKTTVFLKNMVSSNHHLYEIPVSVSDETCLVRDVQDDFAKVSFSSFRDAGGQLDRTLSTAY